MRWGETLPASEFAPTLRTPSSLLPVSRNDASTQHERGRKLYLGPGCGHGVEREGKEEGESRAGPRVLVSLVPRARALKKKKLWEGINSVFLTPQGLSDTVALAYQAGPGLWA